MASTRRPHGNKHKNSSWRAVRMPHHGTVAHTAHAIAHDDTHGRIENVLPALLAAPPTGLAALVLNTFSHGSSNAGGTFLSHYAVHHTSSFRGDAERHRVHSHAERGNDQ